MRLILTDNRPLYKQCITGLILAPVFIIYIVLACFVVFVICAVAIDSYEIGVYEHVKNIMVWPLIIFSLGVIVAVYDWANDTTTL